jgi:hypothetical protein
MDDPDYDSFEDKIRAIARDVAQQLERAAEQVDLDEIAERFGVSATSVRQFAEFAGEWLGERLSETMTGFQEPADPDAPEHEHPLGNTFEESGPAHEPRPPRRGPHPLDLPTAEQGLALSALESGRWRVEPGSNELISDGEGPDPLDSGRLVGELRARDWIAAGGEVTLVGRDALRRWLETAQ